MLVVLQVKTSHINVTNNVSGVDTNNDSKMMMTMMMINDQIPTVHITTPIIMIMPLGSTIQ
jgi:hypothetical protein